MVEKTCPQIVVDAVAGRMRTVPAAACAMIGTVTTAEDILDAAGGAKRAETLLRDARAALRRVDPLARDVPAGDDEIAPLIDEVRSALEDVVRRLTLRRQDELRRARAAVRQGRS